MTVTYRVPGAILTEREHTVPLRHGAPDGRTLTVFTREVAAPDGAERPYLLFLQGGPGFDAMRPTSRRHLSRDLRAAGREEPRVLRALPRRPRPRARHDAPARRRGRPPAVGRSAHRPAVPPARALARRQRRVRAPPPRARAAVR